MRTLYLCTALGYRGGCSAEAHTARLERKTRQRALPEHCHPTPCILTAVRVSISPKIFSITTVVVVAENHESRELAVRGTRSEGSNQQCSSIAVSLLVTYLANRFEKPLDLSLGEGGREALDRH